MKVLLLLLLLLLLLSTAWAKPVLIGSKKFTESVVLSEILRLSFSEQHIKSEHRSEFGGTRILWNALLSGDIDVYPEYSGTVEEEILRKKLASTEELRAELRKFGVGVSGPLGFNNTYAVGMKRDRAQELGIKKISDLIQHPTLKIGWSSEFRQRQDGWPGLKTRYQLSPQSVQGLDHDVAYRAIGIGDIDVIDLYSTDAEIDYYQILVLEDDLQYFPRYDAFFLYRLATEEKILPVLKTLEQKISEKKMIELNKKAKIERLSSVKVAASFLNVQSDERDTRWKRIGQRTLEHLKLVSVSLLFAILVAIPLGVVVFKFRLVGKIVLMIVSAIQTIPALALLVMLIRPLSLLGLSGIGDTPAFVALFLYSLLPIVRNTFSGLQQIPLGLQETALVLGLSRRTRLLKIEIPLAMPSILAGIKTSLVLNIGFATLGALVGAGGYGQPILTGIRLDDYSMILEGAVPAAVCALLAQLLFDYLEKFLISTGLRV